MTMQSSEHVAAQPYDERTLADIDQALRALERTKHDALRAERRRQIGE